MAVPNRREANRKARRAAAKSSGMSPRQCGVVAAVVAAMLTPAVLTGTVGIDWVNVAGTSGIGIGPLGNGDILSALRARTGDGSGDALGPAGRLPETDQLSASLLAEAQHPSDFADNIGPLDSLPQGPLGIPGVMLQAYMNAQKQLAITRPNCHLDWSLLAGIGRIESGHARGGRVDAHGNTASPILGPVLNGAPGMAVINDTDGGAFDGNAAYDRAVGPMQFIPSTWAGYAADGNNDGRSNPNNIYDATVGAGNYLCGGGGDLSKPEQRALAVFRYNRSEEYVRTVLLWADAYAAGVTPLPSSDEVYVPADDSTRSPLQPGISQPPPPSNPPTPTVPGVGNPPPGGSTPGTTPTPSASTPGTTPSVSTPSCPTSTTSPPSNSSSVSPPSSTSPGCPTSSSSATPPPSNSSSTTTTSTTTTSSDETTTTTKSDGTTTTTKPDGTTTETKSDGTTTTTKPDGTKTETKSDGTTTTTSADGTTTTTTSKTTSPDGATTTTTTTRTTSPDRATTTKVTTSRTTNPSCPTTVTSTKTTTTKPDGTSTTKDEPSTTAVAPGCPAS
ncbi:MAG TPA: lytic murein transglycosylase [Pseudonocardiaceae bacterium]|nr:lytic murein transglycosylase [Pseudonocardiaceae bacterium]